MKIVRQDKFRIVLRGMTSIHPFPFSAPQHVSASPNLVSSAGAMVALPSLTFGSAAGNRCTNGEGGDVLLVHLLRMTSS